MHSSSTSYANTMGGYRRTGVSSGLPTGPSATRGSYTNNRTSFNGSSTVGAPPSKQGTTLAHAARNGVMNPSSSLRSQQSNGRIQGAATQSSTSTYPPYGTGQTSGVRGQSRGKPGSRPIYEKQSSNVSSTSNRQAAQQQQYSGATSSGYYARKTNNGQSTEEETKVRSSQASIYVRQGQRQGQSTFGDFTGNIKNFQITEEDQLSSRKHLNQQSGTENIGDFGQPQLNKERSHQVGNPSMGSQLSAAAAQNDRRRPSAASESGSTLSRTAASFTPTGLRNIGNTCFMNSILQPLMATPYLNDYFLSHFPRENHHRSTRLAQTYYELLKTCRDSGGSAVTPSAIKNAVSRTVSQFSGYGQQDSQEFLRFLIDRMHDELNRVTTKPPYKELNCPNLPISQQSTEWARYYKARDDSIMSDLFEGQLINRTQCLSCGFQDCAFDNFMDLSIEIPRKAVRFLGSIKLSECLDKFIEPERMVDTGFKCSKCKRKVDIEKDLTIYRFPKVLVIHLKRFYHSTMRREKLNTTVSFPEVLDMSSYAPHSEHGSKRKASYQLYGITHHSGSLYGGHYISEVYNFADKRWYDCNDSHVSRSSGPDTSSSSAYLLFYVMRADQ